MNRKLYKELWRMRFEKMLRLENQSIEDYETLLRESRTAYKEHPIQPHLERLIRDERKHARLVEELLVILERQKED